MGGEDAVAAEDHDVMLPERGACPAQRTMLRFAGLGFAGHNTHRLAGGKANDCRRSAGARAECACAGGRSPDIPRDYNFAADVLERNLDAGRADKPAFIDPRGTWTYGAARRPRRALRRARCAALGIRREERVLIALLDTIDWPTAFLGCLKAGVIAVPVNTLLTEDDYRFMLADSRARCLVVSEVLYPQFEKLIAASPRPRARHRLRRQCARVTSASTT